jgi:hypothetical protein
MATFPVLKTKAVAQYPASKTIQFQNQVLRFVEGLEQRYRDSMGPLHRWVISMKELDESEITALEEFFASNQGRFASFPFTDPWDGQTYANCSLAADDLNMMASGEMLGKTSLTVTENRG